jgi:hypothetical protein
MRAVWTAIAVAGGLGLGALAGSANAAVTLKFSGDCSDCTGISTGTLTLATMPDGTIDKSDFVNFIYKSNLVSFTINSSDIVAVMGSIDPNNLGKAYIDIIQLGGTGWEFERNADGTWSVYNQITGGQSHASSVVAIGGGGGGSPAGFGGSSDDSSGGSSSGGTGSDGSGSGGNSSGGSSSGGDGPGVVSTFSFSSGGDDFVIDRVNDDTGPNSLVAVPEPATWAMMLLGFGGMGAMLRSRRRSPRGIEIA